MLKWKRIPLAVVVIGLAAAAVTGAGHAQVPQIDPPWTGELPPPGGVALVAASRETDARSVVDRLRQEGCNVAALAVSETGGWRTYIPGGPGFVNAAFPAMLLPGQPFAVRCASADVPLTLTAADDGTTVHLAVHGRLRVALPANPSTGFAWRVEPTLPPTVVASIGDPAFIPVSGLIGAPGTMMLDFSAVGPGLVPLRLVYDRAFETLPPEDEWTVTVIVSGQQPVGWLGEVRAQPAAPPGAHYLELRVSALPEGHVPPGVGLVGSDAATANAIEAFSDTGEAVFVWGELTCGVVDYGDCRIDATAVLPAATAPLQVPYPVVGWAGTLGSVDERDYFQLAGRFPVQYGVAGSTPDVEAQLAEARERGQPVRVWGALQVPADDVNHARIIVTELGLAPLLGTQVIRFAPKPPPGATAVAGECFSTSLAAPWRGDAWRCATENELHDPCFALTADTLLCGADPVSGEHGFLLQVAEPLASAQPPEAHAPSNGWLVRLADGTICNFATGATGGVDDKRANYACTDRRWILGDLEPGDPWSADVAMISVGPDGWRPENREWVAVAVVWQ